MIKTKNICILLVLTGVFLSADLKAQERPEHELHSMMIYNFLKYIQWPGAKNTGDFVIGVLGDDNVYTTLNSWYGDKTRGDKTFVVKRFETVNDIQPCQILYLGTDASDLFDDVQVKLINSSTLTITDKHGLGAKGSCINFRVIDKRLKFELNQASMQRSNLKISSQLSSMAILL